MTDRNISMASSAEQHLEDHLTLHQQIEVTELALRIAVDRARRLATFVGVLTAWVAFDALRWIVG